MFLDEIGDTDLGIQPKLLKVVEEKRFRRLGEVGERRVDVRFLAATNRELSQLVDEGSFREDLYYRINTLVLRLPPLRHRKDDCSTGGAAAPAACATFAVRRRDSTRTSRRRDCAFLAATCGSSERPRGHC
jgi:transcriptional regulator with GAF, ATPase, and Fis domain